MSSQDKSSTSGGQNDWKGFVRDAPHPNVEGGEESGFFDADKKTEARVAGDGPVPAPQVDFHQHRGGSPLKEHEADALRNRIKTNYFFSDVVKHGVRSAAADQLPQDFPKLQLATEAVKVPRSKSLAMLSPEVYNQGEVGCCVGNSVSMAWRLTRLAYNYESYIRTYVTGYSDYTPSRAYIYANAKIAEGSNVHRDGGCTVHGALLAASEYHMCSEQALPYTEDNCLCKPPLSAYHEAKSHSSPRFTRVTGGILGIKASIARGCPVMFGAVLYPEVKNSSCLNTGDIPMPRKFERPMGGHCMLIVGYDDGEEMVEIQNSWGRLWGNGGFGRMPYQYIDDPELCGDFWAFST